MKSLIKYGLFILAVITASCDKLLDVNPVTEIGRPQAFESIASSKGAVNGLYNNLQGVYDWRVQLIGDLLSDMSQQVDTWDAFISLDELAPTADNNEVLALYTILYRCVDISNNIIEYVPQIEGATEAEINDLVGQAYFIRGLSYFELARFWGGIPNVYGQQGVVIKLTPSVGVSEEDFAPRATLRATYDQVEADLLEALRILPDTRGDNTLSRGYAIKASARALLSRYYLYNQDWAKAESFATEVINNSMYSLVPYDQIFRSKNSAESIFELQYTSSDPNGMRNWYYPSNKGGRGGAALHTALYQELTADPNDDRGTYVDYNGNAAVYYTTKWDMAGNADNSQVLRLAEQYLIRAEARAEKVSADLAGAVDDLNAVRNRAGISDFSSTDKQAILDAILQERKLEFVGEGHRWFDVIRKGKAMETFKNIVRTKGSLPSYSLASEDLQVLPFPTRELNANKNLEQNAAYK